MNKIIVMFEDGDREVYQSLYDFIDWQYRYANLGMVCHVTEEEYSNMREQVRLGWLHERLPSGINTDIGYNKFRYLITYNREENNLLVSDYNNPNKRGSYTIDINGITYDESGYQITNHPIQSIFASAFSGVKVYTTETYEDVISHYELKQNREYLINEKTKELIELIGHSCKTCNTKCCGGLGDNNNCERWSHIIR